MVFPLNYQRVEFGVPFRGPSPCCIGFFGMLCFGLFGAPWGQGETLRCQGGVEKSPPKNTNTSNVAMENGPSMDCWAIKSGDFPLALTILNYQIVPPKIKINKETKLKALKHPRGALISSLLARWCPIWLSTLHICHISIMGCLAMSGNWTMNPQ